MARMVLSLETLKDFNMGKAHVAFQLALATVVKDLLDRPGDKSARKVILTANIVPVVQQDGDVVDAAVDFTVQAKMPAYQTSSKPVAVDRQGRLFFNDMAADNPHQATIDEQGE